MKKFFLFLFSLMFMVNINAVGVSGASHEGETNSVILQTHDIVQPVAIQIVKINSVMNDVFLQKESPPLIKPFIANNITQASFINTSENDITFRKNLNQQTITNYLNYPSRCSNYNFITTKNYTNTNNIRAVNYLKIC